MAEQDNIQPQSGGMALVGRDNIEAVEELPEPQIETPIKIKKPMSSERLEQLKQARIKAQEKKHEMKELKTKAKQLPIEEVKLSAMKYDELQKRKEDFIKTKDQDVVIAKTEITAPKTKDKKKRIIKKIVYEDGSEDEVEDVRHIQPKQNNNPYNHESYSNLVYLSACDRLKEKVQDERTKYLISSLMPNYG